MCFGHCILLLCILFTLVFTLLFYRVCKLIKIIEDFMAQSIGLVLKIQITFGRHLIGITAQIDCSVIIFSFIGDQIVSKRCIIELAALDFGKLVLPRMLSPRSRFRKLHSYVVRINLLI